MDALPHASRRRGREGAILLETLVALTVLTVGILNAVTTAVRCSRLQRTTSEYVQAHNASRNVIERLRDADLDGQYDFFTANPIFRLDGQEVEVRFPQDVLERALGAPPPATLRYVDLDADGIVDRNAASTDPASLLPVRITVRQGDTFRFELVSLLTEK